jgi:hypothetical protein
MMDEHHYIRDKHKYDTYNIRDKHRRSWEWGQHADPGSSPIWRIF